MYYKWIMLMVSILICFCGAKAADQDAILQQSAGELFQALPENACNLLQSVDITQTAESWNEGLLRLFQSVDTKYICLGAMRSLTRMMVVAVLIGVLSGLRGAADEGSLPVTTMAGALSMTGILLGDLRGMLSLCVETLNQTSVFSTALLPVMAGALTVSGAPATATITQGVTLFALDLLIRCVTHILVPAVCAYIAIITVNAALGNDILSGLAVFIKWLTTGSLKLILTVFVAYLSISSTIGGSVDAVTLKTAKFAVSGSVPVVGGIISDATESMLAGMSVIKNSIGILGMLGVAAICIVPFLQVGINYLLFKAGTAILSPLCNSSLEKLMAGLSDSLGMMLGMLGTCSAVIFFELVFSITMVKPI